MLHIQALNNNLSQIRKAEKKGENNEVEKFVKCCFGFNSIMYNFMPADDGAFIKSFARRDKPQCGRSGDAEVNTATGLGWWCLSAPVEFEWHVAV
jgi:hypothetical protein